MRVFLINFLFMALLGISSALPYVPLNHRHHRRGGNDVTTTYETIYKTVFMSTNADGTSPVTSYQTSFSSSTAPSSFATTPFFKMNATSAPWNNNTIAATSTSVAPNMALNESYPIAAASISAEATSTSSTAAQPASSTDSVASSSSAIPTSAALASASSTTDASTPITSSSAPLPSGDIQAPNAKAANLNTYSTSSPASSSASSSTSSSASATPSGNKSSKRGLAWIPGTSPSVADKFKGVANWYYNWGSSPSNLDSSFEFIQSQHSADGIESASSTFSNGATVIGFNEPDLSSLDAGYAASLYKQYLTPLRQSGGIKYLGSPAISNVGEDWLSKFMQSCSDCRIDFIATHWYGTSANQLKDLVNSLSSTYSKPIWVTEFACTNWDLSKLPSMSDVSSVFQDSIEFLENNGAVERYSWFAPASNLGSSVGENNALVNAAGELSELGSKYVSL
ncbi:cell wall protein Asl1 [Schizosaccharomyces cryophilus OY26]|uniref:Cell wall protein Asl1 n=1 Tax=Schizosaccharomyces cryophilus (strain OY26 / ATCC MYA-4695 / CBS 11777 / NBRC 106824 / NRRL Y48691) TaxID=653667 RepID=S9W409_SCHCR|nr:cell wall protein Asl1 [Schizosaccharomyces cryophilus OY26]EPY52690.1 cell wall protein Asl1 [Schizosaccharomyces cryophilus OY26]